MTAAGIPIVHVDMVVNDTGDLERLVIKYAHNSYEYS